MEVLHGVQALTGVILAGISSFFWMLGGRSQAELDAFHVPFKARTWGRIIAPLFFGTGLCLLSLWAGHFRWWDLAVLALLKAVSHTGHGGKTFLEKLQRRTINAVFWVLPAVYISIIHGGWWILATHLIIALSGSILWGIDNPRVSPTEEVKINLCKTLSYPFYFLS